MARITCVVALCAGLVGYGALDAYDKVPGVLTIDPDTPTAVAAPTTPGVSQVPRVRVPTPRALPARAVAPAPSAAGLGAALRQPLADPRLGSVSLTVRDGMTGAHLLDVAADTPRTPASTAKLLTAAAVLPALGPDTRLTTSTLLAPDGTVVLRAGGDMLLGRGASRPDRVEGHAGIGTLADATAAALRRTGRTQVRLRLDLTHAAGPDYAPTWDPAFLGEGIVGKVAALGLADDLAEPGHPAPEDPAGQAGRVFREGLRRAGIAVDGELATGATPSGARPLAEVQSAPVADVLSVALARSDNALTESLARQAAVRSGGVPPGRADFPAVAAWVTARLRAQGLDLRGVRLADSCGLSRGTTVPARAVGDVVARGATGADAVLARVVSDLPVGGLTGTLGERYLTGVPTAGAGVVRAKTGTLTGVSSLAGTVVDKDGRTLAFAAIANDVPASTGTLGARDALDTLATRLAGCGCR